MDTNSTRTASSTPDTGHRPSRRRIAHAARTIERRPPTQRVVWSRHVTPTSPVAPITSSDEAPLLLGSHLTAQLFVRQWRWA